MYDHARTAIDRTDTNIEVPFETTIPWRDVTLTNQDGTGIPILESVNNQHHIIFYRADGSNTFRIYIW